MAATDDLPVSEYGFPGPLRDSLVAAILRGEKTSTTSLLFEYEREGEPLPEIGDRAVVSDSAGDPVGIEEIVEVRVARIADVDLEHALAEGEGFTSVAEWRAGHERFWHGFEYRTWVADPAFRVTDDTLAVLVQFRFAPI
ncbi:MAG: ASCH domain-containing protein [Actinobacteria bacterium]|nr:ASCH domain-containing protein [Actinomycetota bacterium]